MIYRNIEKVKKRLILRRNKEQEKIGLRKRLELLVIFTMLDHMIMLKILSIVLLGRDIEMKENR